MVASKNQTDHELESFDSGFRVEPQSFLALPFLVAAISWILAVLPDVTFPD